MTRRPLPLVSLILTMVVIIAVAGGCGGVGIGDTIDPRTANLDVPYPDSATVPELVLNFGAADFEARPGGAALLAGEVVYNVAGLNPEVDTDANRVEVTQTSNVTPINMTNDWRVSLGTARPFRLEINAGAYEGDWDLGGVPLQELEVAQGASRSTFDFSSPNPESMRRLEFRTGGAELTLLHLGNANFEEMTFEGGAASYTLDFGGRLAQDGDVSIRTGVSNLRLVIPAGTPAEIEINRGLSNVDAADGFVQRDDRYYTPAWDTAAGPALTITVDVGLGNVELELGASEGSEI